MRVITGICLLMILSACEPHSHGSPSFTMGDCAQTADGVKHYVISRMSSETLMLLDTRIGCSRVFTYEGLTRCSKEDIPKEVPECKDIREPQRRGYSGWFGVAKGYMGMQP